MTYMKTIFSVLMLLLAIILPSIAHAAELERAAESRGEQTWTWDGCLGELFVTFQ